MTMKMIDALRDIDKKYGEKNKWNEFEWWALNHYSYDDFKAAFRSGYGAIAVYLTHEHMDKLYNYHRENIWKIIEDYDMARQKSTLEELGKMDITHPLDFSYCFMGTAIEGLAYKILPLMGKHRKG